jgi:serine protease Do
MSTRKSSFFYGTLIALASMVVGMVIASRLDLAPRSFAGNVNMPAVNSAPITGAIDATTFRNIAHDQGPAVVSILVTGKRNVATLEDFFGGQSPFQIPGGRQGGRNGNRQPRQEIVQGAGSGFIIDKSGYILTNNHVIEDADEISVMLADMKNPEDALKAKVVGHDKLTDTALLQLVDTAKQPLAELKFGDSAQMSAGDWVMAIGNPFQLANTVTVGVVSAVGRVSPMLNPSLGRDLEYIQTDAAINQGNSGGPLLNIRGEVIGMNTAIMSEGSRELGGQGGNIGIGFAVPINTIRDVLPQLKTGKVVRGRIGVQVLKTPMTLDEAKDFGLSAPTGAVIDGVEDNCPAKAGGLKAGDVVIEFNGKTIKDSAELVAIVTRTAPGTSVPVKVMRSAKPMTLTVKVEELNLDAEQTAQAGERPHPVNPEQPQDTSFGMTVEPVSPSIAKEAGLTSGKGGALVTDVTPLSAAYRGGMLQGDIILSVNDKDVSSVSDVTKTLDAVPVGRTARVLVWRMNPNSGSGGEHMALLRKR